ncbi:hypothetical protein TUZN_0930 [Thermoproteus uzoniensis 768-20]|uniref:Uncharacterized protein n=1 Tax=Thermoproteus uzoniensis (strain 768-20) TaxID=999630 RepID=F2L5W8_THEU7|nr:hypothetical protein [Thermoproteus uzoniensis]AEA12413.1 hypothetical protein TUZN_0930 [Thermoproteus uzoniensis 768-20]
MSCRLGRNYIKEQNIGDMRAVAGISGVVVTVLLTVIGIVAVLMFWAMFSGFFNPHPKIIIESAEVTQLSPGQYDVSITVREVGGASTQITGAVIYGTGSQSSSQPPQLQCNPPGQSQSSSSSSASSSSQSFSIPVGAGQEVTFYCTYSGNLIPGQTYYLAVYYTSGSSNVRSDLYPVTVH